MVLSLNNWYHCGSLSLGPFGPESSHTAQRRRILDACRLDLRSNSCNRASTHPQRSQRTRLTRATLSKSFSNPHPHRVVQLSPCHLGNWRDETHSSLLRLEEARLRSTVVFHKESTRGQKTKPEQKPHQENKCQLSLWPTGPVFSILETWSKTSSIFDAKWERLFSPSRCV